MSTTLTLKEEETNAVHDMQDDIETEVLIRLLNGQAQYQRLIVNHTCADMFLLKDNKALYNLMLRYFQKKHNLNAYDLIASLKDKDVSYTSYILALKDGFICSADSQNWIIRLQSLYEKRLLTDCNSSEDFKCALAEIGKYKLQVNETHLLETAMQYIDEYEQQAATMIKTGYKNIDKLIGGLQGGNYMVLAGSTGMGKTAMALNLIINIIQSKKNVLLFSLEMTAEELLSRIIANIMRISSENIRNRCMTEKEWEKYLKYVSSKDFQEIQEHLTIPVSANLDIGKIEETVEKSKADIVFIDYLGLIKGDVYKQNTYEQISDISRRLKLLAIETKKPIVVLHQLNRDMKDRADKRPKLSDIRDSGKIEQDADFITFVYRPAYFNINEDKTAMEFIIGKARHTSGAGQCASLCFLGQYQKITENGYLGTGDKNNGDAGTESF